jgi:PAS domain S-box-containing protein
MTTSDNPAFGDVDAPKERTDPDSSGYGQIGGSGGPLTFADADATKGDQGTARAASSEASEVVAQYRKIATAALTEAETWLREGALSRAIPEALPDAVLVSDETGHIVLVNAQLELIFGYHRSEIIGQTLEMLMPEAARASHVAQRMAYSKEPRVRPLMENLKLRGRNKNGSEFSVLIRLGPVVIPDGIYTIAVIRRIHE